MRLTYYFSILIIFISSYNAFSVNDSNAIIPDSLLFSVNSLPNDSSKVIKLNDLSFKYMGIQLDTAFILGKRALDLSEELNFEYGIAKSLFQLGLVFRYQSNYKKAIEYSRISYSLFEKLNKPEEKARVLNSLGNTYKRIGDYKNSVENFLISLKIFTELKDSVKISFVMNNLGVLYQEMGEYEKSLDFHLSNLELRRKIGADEDLILKTLMNIGIVYRELKNYSKAIDYYNEAIKLIDHNTSKYNQTLLLHNMGTIYELAGHLFSAKQYYLKALDIEEEIGERDLYINTLQGIGTVVIQSGDFNTGLDYLLKAYKEAKAQGNLLKWKNTTKSLIWAYETKEDYKNSLYYHKIYQSVNDSLMGLEKIKQITELEQKYEAEKREQQITFLEKEQEIQKLNLSKKTIEANQKSLQRNLLIVIALLAVFFVLFLIRKNKKITNQRSKIIDQNEKLLESNKTKDKLFQIIAHDLRSPLVSIDSLTQLIPYWVEIQDYESLKRLSKTMELSVTNVLSLIDDLLNWALSQQGNFPYNPVSFKINVTIKDAISLYIPIAQIKNIKLQFNASKDSVVYADKNMFLTVLRNLLNNAIKFTPEKGEIVIGVDFTKQFAKVWVKDSGIGIPEEKKEKIFELAGGNTVGVRGETGKGLGLFFCKEFVNMNNGDIFIEDGTQKGTTIIFTIPLYNLSEN